VTRRRARQSGLTLIELIIAFTIMLILTTMALPLARIKVRREKERELRYALREVRAAIDKYKDASDRGVLPPGKVDSEGYPPDLQTMVDGVKKAGTVDTKIRFLRRIPRDPLTGQSEWGLRSVQDDPASQSWGGQNVFDVYSKSMDTALDGTKYNEW
jgi:general secretion pathway protein G